MTVRTHVRHVGLRCRTQQRTIYKGRHHNNIAYAYTDMQLQLQ